MLHQFRVNVGTPWKFEIDDGSLVTSLSGPDGPHKVEAIDAIAEALGQPLGFPSLHHACVPGDRVVVAVDALLPCPVSAAAGVVEALRRAGANLNLITLLCPESLAGLAGQAGHERRYSCLAQVQIVIHDPQERGHLAYLAATSDDRPIYLNRLLCDADLVVPLTCFPPPGNLRGMGVFGSVYPAFSDASAIRRLRNYTAQVANMRRDPRRLEADEVGWLLGVCVAVGAIPGRNGTLSRAVAGTPDQVRDVCERMAADLWRMEVPRRVPLVIMLLSDHGGELGWDDFAAALSAAGRTAGEGGAVVICGDFRLRPGRSLHRLTLGQDAAVVAHRLQTDHHDDTWAAQELVSALQRGPVFFAGGLNGDLVEGLGMAPIREPEQITRLARQFEECVVISDAQLASPRLAGESRPAA